MSKPIKISRRSFIKASVAGGSALALGFTIHAAENNSTQAAVKPKLHAFQPNVWLSIYTNNSVIIKVHLSEMGQGVLTSLPMLVAEEMELDWRQVQVEHAPYNPLFGHQYTGQSASIRKSWKKLRTAGAIARDMLLQAAANNWGIDPNECIASDGIVLHTASQRKISYGELITAASKLEVPETTTLKDPKHFKIIGQAIPRLDIPDKVNGQGIYGTDIILPDMLIATMVHSPVYGASAKKFDATRALKIKGVKHIIEINSGIAVVADNFWAAKKGADALKIQWSKEVDAQMDSAYLSDQLKTLLDQEGRIAFDQGSSAESLNSANKRIEAIYELPFQAHATMEPMSCTAHVHDGGCEVWAPSQVPTMTYVTARNMVLSSPEVFYHKIMKRIDKGHIAESIKSHTTLLGGGFGRRLKQDYVEEAIQISQAIRKPIKLIWTREEDIQHDFYHPTNFHKLQAGLNVEGKPVAWKHRLSGPFTKEKGARIPYDIENISIDIHRPKTNIPTGSWRSVHDHYNAFVTESFIDELAFAANKDPLSYRLELLKNKPEHRAVLKLAAKKAQWKKQLSLGHGHGIALNHSFGSYVAQVAEVSLNKQGKIIVHKIVCAVNCGSVVNPDTVAAQIESGIVFGLTAALKSRMTFKDGRAEQSNFHDYPLLQIHEMPVVETHIIPSEEPPQGVGEISVPGIAPAVANALFAATGKRIRKMPFNLAIHETS